MRNKLRIGQLVCLVLSFALLLSLQAFQMPSIAANGLGIDVSSNDADAGALFSVSFSGEDGEGNTISFISVSNAAAYHNTVDTAGIIEQIQSWTLYINLDSFDEENYLLSGFEINGVFDPDFKSYKSSAGDWYTIVNYEHQSPDQLDEITDISIKAIFVRRGLPAANTPTVTVAESDQGKGVVSEMNCVSESEAGSEWLLTAQPGDGYQLAYIQENGNASSRIYSTDGTSIRWTLSQNTAYTAFFEKAAMHFDARSFAYAPWRLSSGWQVNLSPKPIAAGQRAGFFFTYSLPSKIPGHSTFRYALYAGTDTGADPLASYSRTYEAENYAQNGKRMILTVDPLPETLEAVTITLQINDGPVVSETFPVEVQPSAELDLCFFSVPAGSEMKSIYPSDCRTAIGGPNVYDAAAFTDENTGELRLYFAVSGGVMELDGAQSLKYMDGMLFGYNDGEQSAGYPFAIGGTDQDHLAALVKTSSGSFYTGITVGYSIYECVNGTWSMVEGSALDDSYSQMFQVSRPCGLVMSKNDIWICDRHWNGASWTDNGFDFNSFWKENNSSAYAGSADGLYHYDGTSWTPVEGVSGLVRIDSADRNCGKVTLVSAAEKLITVENGAATVSTVPNKDGIVSGNPDSSFLYVGIDENGELYGIVPARLYQNEGTSGYTGTYLYKLTDGSWVNQTVSAFNDPHEDDDPNSKLRADGVDRVFNPCEGVSLFVGASGAIYGKYGDATITFETNGGSTVAPITQTIHSAVIPPSAPEKEGYTFIGWYMLADFLQNGPAFVWSVMPAKNVTLYAKWVENSAGGDVFATERNNAFNSLDAAFNRLTESEYTGEVWGQITSAYEAGAAAIRAATTYNGIYAALNDAVDRINTLSQNTNQTITVAVTVEKLTVDGEYIIEPTLVEVKKFTQASVVVTDLLNAKYAGTYDGTPYRITGSVTSSFYLAGIYDPTYIPAASGVDGKNAENEYFDQSYEGYLSELDGGRWSGWMYCVNGKFPGVGASGWTLMNGEVMRWQYSCVGLGCDIGADNTEWGATESAQVADKDALIWKVAEINRAGTRTAYGEAYTNAKTVLKTIEASQEAVDSALAALNAIDGVETVTAASNANGSSVTAGGKTMNLTANGSAAVTATVSANNVVTLAVQTKKTSNSQQVDSTRITLSGTAAYTDGSNTFTVTSTGDVPCVILVKKADGSYERRTFATAASVHSVTLAADEEIVVAVKGDATGDGQISAADWSAVIARFKSGSFSGLPAWVPLLYDVNGDGSISAGDWSVMISSFKGITPMSW